MSFSLSSEEWKSVAKVFLKAVERRLSKSEKAIDEWQQKALDFLTSNIHLTEEENVSFELFH